MNYWQDLLSAHPHTLDENGQLAIGTEQLAHQPLEEKPYFIPRTDLGVLRASGGDWRKMLQGQTTCDVTAVTPDQSVPGALCTPKGRVIANFHLLQDGDDALIITQRSAVPALLATLGKFAPFFKVKLEQTEQPLLATLTHPESVTAMLTTRCGDAEASSDCTTTPGLVMSWRHGQTVVISPQQLLLTLEDPQQAWQQLCEVASLAGTATATLADIRDGQAWVTAATSDEFLPQMLALHRTGAVSFKKGCYTGQEVVARMQYLGTLKRNLYRIELSLEQAPATGTPCYLPGASQNCGHIVMSASSTSGAVEALAVLTDEAAASPLLLLDKEGEPVPTQQRPLPFVDEPA